LQQSQTSLDPRAEARKTLATVPLGAVGLAAWRVADTMPHPHLGPLVEETALLLASWVMTLGTAVMAIWLLLRAHRRMPAGSHEAAREHLAEYPHEKGDDMAFRQHVEQRVAQGLRSLYARHPLYPVIAILAAVIFIDGLLTEAATKAPAIAKGVDIVEFPLTLVMMIGGAIYAKRLIKGGGAKRAPRSVAALARRLQPPESGALVDPHDLGVPMPSQQAPAIAVIGSSGSGKSHLLASMITCWPGPVKVATTKIDLPLYGATAKALQYSYIGENPRQSAQLYDPAGLLGDHWARRDWDPSQVPTGANSQLHAAEMARVMAEELQSGQGGPFWALRAEPILTALLALGALQGNLASLVAQLAYAGPQEQATLLAQGANTMRQAGNTTTDMLERQRFNTNANMLDGMTASLLDESTSRRAYDEFASAMAALQPLLRVHGSETTNGSLPKLDLGAWARSQGLAGIVVPPQMGKALGPLVAAFIQDAIEQLRATQGQRKWASLIVLDEVANVADLPILGTWATELRGWDAYLVVAAQSSEQFRRWDHYDPVAFITHHFPLTLVAEGAAEHQLARLVSERHGTHVVTQDSQSANPWRERVPVVPPEQVFGAYRGPGHWVGIYQGQRARTYSLEPVDALLDRLQSAVQSAEERQELRAQRATVKSAKRLGLREGNLP
jgi:hypothetical protein